MIKRIIVAVLAFGALLGIAGVSATTAQARPHQYSGTAYITVWENGYGQHQQPVVQITDRNSGYYSTAWFTYREYRNGRVGYHFQARRLPINTGLTVTAYQGGRYLASRWLYLSWQHQTGYVDLYPQYRR
ncbi:hypothetical protein HH308_08040 [Gordonia sp. TBRC 11910]|uniref:Uncharacterized protein n=1 Tax=Gordonia asplenii TaxID=2725283 RepID=A0A848KT45_9ACTN|nr:hypothetical protein [Gordonia asplenii]NMO01167.1 hypothetical protein [Gordonia asplenii]